MKGVCIIPARGGSKRLPRKNVLDFKGYPIISYTIRAALDSSVFEDVVVSTEDEEIAEVSKNYGADVSLRRANLASDSARVVDVCSDFLEREGHNYDFFACLYATSPLRNKGDIISTYNLLSRGECHFAMAVTEYYYPPYQALTKSDGNFFKPMWPDLVKKRSQELPRFFVDNGSTYFCFTDAFLEKKNFYGPSLRGHFMEPNRSIDIDTEPDLQMAEYFWNEFCK